LDPLSSETNQKQNRNTNTQCVRNNNNNNKKKKQNTNKQKKKNEKTKPFSPKTTQSFVRFPLPQCLLVFASSVDKTDKQ